MLQVEVGKRSTAYLLSRRVVQDVSSHRGRETSKYLRVARRKEQREFVANADPWNNCRNHCALVSVAADVSPSH